MLGTQNAFLPDGRPLNWPANFPKVLDAVCSEVGLPLLNTGRLVTERGGAFAIKQDLIHFTPQMISVMADEMLAMGRERSTCRRPAYRGPAPAATSWGGSRDAILMPSIYIINPRCPVPGYHTAEAFADGRGGRTQVADLAIVTVAALVSDSWEST